MANLVLDTYITRGYLSKEFFNEYLLEHTKYGKKVNKIFDEFDEHISCYVLSLNDKFKRKGYYGNLWFIDINLSDGTYLPIYVDCVNGSSCYALSMCSFYDDEEPQKASIKFINLMLQDCNREQIWNIIWENI